MWDGGFEMSGTTDHTQTCGIPVQRSTDIPLLLVRWLLPVTGCTLPAHPLLEP